ncbi:MAG: restriction endonuclease subunit S [Promethearchaeota archaeon]
MTHSIIQKSQLEGAHRIDAEYYQPEYLEIENILVNNSIELGKIAYVTDGEHGSPVFDENSGIKYFSAQYILDGYFDLSDIKFIDRKIHDKNKRSQLRDKDILLSIVGTVGNAALVTKDILPANSDRHVATIRIEEKSFLPEYIVTFLNSEYGKLQTTREAAGNVQPILILERVRNLLIPRIKNQQQIADLYNKGSSSLAKSKQLYQQAENLLLEELGLKDFEIENELSNIVNFSDIQNTNRIDAEYFQKKYERLIERIKSKNSELLGDLVSMTKGFEPGSNEYQEEGKQFIRVSSLSEFGIENKDQKYLSDELYQRLKNNFEPKIGEILLTKDATPGIAYTIKEPIEGVISSGILRLKLKNKIEPEYLTLCINSIIGKWQAERDAGGSVISHWKPEQIKKVVIPILSKAKQEKIADLVRKSHQARQKAKKLLEEAKNKVEAMIEKGK